MKQISTGTGLVVLSGTILASVCLSSPRTATTAFASSQQPQPADRGIGRKADAAAPVAMLSDCELTPENFFNPIPNKISACVEFGCQSISMADVNGDGKADYFSPLEMVFHVIDNGQVLSGLDILLQTMLEHASQGSSIKTKIVWNTGNLGNYLKSIFPDAPNVITRIKGWRDCDGDGDLDLVCAIETDGGLLGFVYFENTGFQHTAPLEGDINHDGQVDSADVGVLLLNFDA